MSKHAKFTKQGHVGQGGHERQVQVHENGIDAWLAWHMQLLAQPSQAQFQTESPTQTPTHCSALGPTGFQLWELRLSGTAQCSSLHMCGHRAEDGWRRNVLQFKGDGTKLCSALFEKGDGGLWTKNSYWLARWRVWQPQRGLKLSLNSILTTRRIRNTVGDQ